MHCVSLRKRLPCTSFKLNFVCRAVFRRARIRHLFNIWCLFRETQRITFVRHIWCWRRQVESTMPMPSTSVAAWSSPLIMRTRKARKWHWIIASMYRYDGGCSLQCTRISFLVVWIKYKVQSNLFSQAYTVRRMQFAAAFGKWYDTQNRCKHIYSSFWKWCFHCFVVASDSRRCRLNGNRECVRVKHVHRVHLRHALDDDSKTDEIVWSTAMAVNFCALWRNCSESDDMRQTSK